LFFFSLEKETTRRGVVVSSFLNPSEVEPWELIAFKVLMSMTHRMKILLMNQ
jgi:hypothetical protein